MVHGTHGEQRRDGDVLVIDVAVGEDDIVISVVNTLLGVVAQAVDGLVETLAAHGRISGSLKGHAEFACVEAFIADVAKNVELGVGQDGVGQTHHLAVGLVGVEDAGAHAADVLRETHHEVLTDGVDGRVGDLRELLAEVIEEDLRFGRQHGQRRVVAHGSRRLLSLGGHRDQRVLDVFLAKTKLHLFGMEVIYAVANLAARANVGQVDAIGVEPLAIRMLRSETLLDLSIVVDLSLFGIDEQDLTRLQASFFCDLGWVEVHHADLRGHHHGAVLGDRVAGRAQTIAVEHTSGVAAVAEHQGGRTVPRLHEDGMIFIEGLQILADRVLVVEALRNHHRQGVRQTHAVHDEEFKDVVQRGRVTHVGLHDRRDVADVAECL